MTLLLGLISPLYSGFASPEYKTTVGHASSNMTFSSTTNNTNIVLVHGIWSDGSVWSKVIPILQDAGNRVVAAQLPLRSLGDDVATLKRAAE